MENAVNNKILSSHEPTVNSFTQTQINSMVINVNSADKNSFILDFFANKLHPISMLNEGIFKYLIQTAKVELNERSVIKEMTNTSIQIKDAIRSRIKHTVFALKIDLIVGAELIIMGIHIQHIFNKEINLYTLSLQQILSNTTDAQIRIMILEVLCNYKIDINQILITTTDLNILDSMKHRPEGVRIVNYFKLACNDFLHFVGCTRTIPATRLIQKCIKRVLINSELESHLNMCHNSIQLYNNLNMSSNQKTRIYFTQRPPFSCWKSALEIVNNFLELKASYFHQKENTRLIATPEQIIFLDDFVIIFNLIQKLMIKLEDATFGNNTFSHLYIVLMELKLVIKKSTKTKLGTIFLDELEKSFTLIMKDDIFLSSIYLDPRIRLCLDTVQTTSVKSLLTNLYKKINTLKNKKQRSVINSVTKPPQLSLDSSAEKNNSMFQAYLASLEKNRPLELDQSQLNLDFSCYELECYNHLPMETNILEFWCAKQNSLTELANAIQAIPITQLTMDRNVLAYNYVHDNHLVLSEVENILLIKFNSLFQYT